MFEMLRAEGAALTQWHTEVSGVMHSCHRGPDFAAQRLGYHL